ncbi:MAG TPA: hypothetical protein VHE23_01195 [Candidatus Acidoferrales bacterium]|nr:hypothetical protein [Candidatus Acidoferrales bacterium]
MRAVPLVVTGVDALGRSFKERTSTLIINCHGCRYQSKHYVLKGTWVTLEIPHQGDGAPLVNLRGRVAWIQRPRTGRELFHIAVEHEVPGNIWGIAFPPQDWFPFPEADAAALSRAAVQPEELPKGESELPILLHPEPPAEEKLENLRVFPAPADPDASLLHAEPLAEAQPQILAPAQEAAQRIEEPMPSLVQPHISSAQEAVEHLAVDRSVLDAAVAQQEAKIGSITDEAFATALSRFREQCGTVKNELHDSVQTIVTRNLSGLEEQLRSLVQPHISGAQKAVERLAEGRSLLDAAVAQQEAKIRSITDEAFAAPLARFREKAGAVENELHDSVQNIVARNLAGLEEKLRSLVQPHISGAQEAVERLAEGRSLLDAAVAQQEAKIRSITDEAFAGPLARFREKCGAVENELHDSAQTILVRNLAELEDKASDMKHATVDSLYKSAEWYEKKAQVQLQQIIEKGVEMSGQQLRDRAGEVAGVFATEIDGQSRSFVDHAQRQMEETLRDCFERSRALFTEAAETTSSTFTDEIQRQARGELDGFGAALQKTAEETRVQAESVSRELIAQLTAEQESFLGRFQSNMTRALETGVAVAQEQVQGGLAKAVESWGAMAREQQQKLFEMYGRLGDEAVEQFRGRLENMSNSWMVATVTTLDHQSRDVVTGVAKAAEDKLRETCAQVFANVGDTLRERLKEISSAFSGPPTSKPSS